MAFHTSAFGPDPFGFTGGGGGGGNLIVNLAKWLNKISGSPLFGYLASLPAADQQRQLQAAYMADVEGDISLARSIGGGLYDYVKSGGQALGARGEAISEHYYDPQRVEDRFKGAFGDVQSGYESLPGEIDDRTQSILEGYARRGQELPSEFQRQAAGIEAGYGARTAGGLGIIEGYGGQQRADIQDRFADLAQQQAAELTSRGLSASTVQQSMRQGLEREQGSELRRLGEDLTRLRFGAYTGLSGEELGARERFLNTGTQLRTGLTGEALAAAERGRDVFGSTQFGALGGQANIAGSGLGYQDAATQERLRNLGYFGGMPFDYALAGAAPWMQYEMNINRYPPQQYQWPNFS